MVNMTTLLFKQMIPTYLAYCHIPVPVPVRVYAGVEFNEFVRSRYIKQQNSRSWQGEFECEKDWMDIHPGRIYWVVFYIS
jgi:hypothetical protein